MPIAIQINQEPGPENPIWLPHETNQHDWILAKFWLAVAESNFHQVSTKLEIHLFTKNPQSPNIVSQLQLTLPHILSIFLFQLNTLLLRTNLTTESFALSTWRNLASPHPVFKLLQPHIHGVFATNTVARKELIGSDGIVNQSLSLGGGGHVAFMEKCFKEVSKISK